MPVGSAIIAYLLMRRSAGCERVCGQCSGTITSDLQISCERCSADLRLIGLRRRGEPAPFITAVLVGTWMVLFPLFVNRALPIVRGLLPHTIENHPTITLSNPSSGAYTDVLMEGHVEIRAGWNDSDRSPFRKEWNASFRNDGESVASVSVDLLNNTIHFDSRGESSTANITLDAQQLGLWLRSIFSDAYDKWWLDREAEEIMRLADDWMNLKSEADRIQEQFENNNRTHQRAYRSMGGSGSFPYSRADDWVLYLPALALIVWLILAALILPIARVIMLKRMQRVQASVTGPHST